MIASVRALISLLVPPWLQLRFGSTAVRLLQTTMFFVILVTHSKLVLVRRQRIAAISAANCQSGVEDGCYREKFRNFVAWAEPDPKTALFRIFGVPSTILCTAYRKQFCPKPMVPMESRDSEGVPFIYFIY